MKEAELEELQSQFVLGNLRVDILFLGRDLDIKHRKPGADILSEIISLRLWDQPFIGVADILLGTVLAENTELSWQIIELTDQLNDHIDDSGIGPVGGQCAVSAPLARGLLKCGNSRGGGHARRSVACAGLGVSAGLPQLLNGPIQYTDIDRVQGVVLDPSQSVVAGIGNMNERL